MSHQIEQAEGPPMERPSDFMSLTFGHITTAIPDVSYEFDKPELTRRVLMLAEHQDQIANYLQGFIDAPTRRDFDALVAENDDLRQRVSALETLVARFAKAA